MQDLTFTFSIASTRQCGIFPSSLSSAGESPSRTEQRASEWLKGQHLDTPGNEMDASATPSKFESTKKKTKFVRYCVCNTCSAHLTHSQSHIHLATLTCSHTRTHTNTHARAHTHTHTPYPHATLHTKDHLSLLRFTDYVFNTRPSVVFDGSFNAACVPSALN